MEIFHRKQRKQIMSAENTLMTTCTKVIKTNKTNCTVKKQQDVYVPGENVSNNFTQLYVNLQIFIYIV